MRRRYIHTVSNKIQSFVGKTQINDCELTGWWLINTIPFLHQEEKCNTHIALDSSKTNLHDDEELSDISFGELLLSVKTKNGEEKWVSAFSLDQPFRNALFKLKFFELLKEDLLKHIGNECIKYNTERYK